MSEATRLPDWNAFGGPLVYAALCVTLAADLDPSWRSRDGWWRIKTIWIAAPGFVGRVLVRGRQLDGTHAVAFENAESDRVHAQGRLDAERDAFGRWRDWREVLPLRKTLVRAPGCYGLQIDTPTATERIVFRATDSVTKRRVILQDGESTG